MASVGKRSGVSRPSASSGWPEAPAEAAAAVQASEETRCLGGDTRSVPQNVQGRRRQSPRTNPDHGGFLAVEGFAALGSSSMAPRSSRFAPLAHQFDAFLVDLDGVVYVGDAAVPGAADALAKLRKLGKGIAFVTNDPYDSRENYVARLARHGIVAEIDDVLTSSVATASEVARRHGPEPAVYVVGSAALHEELRAAGIECLPPAEIGRADAVVLGWHSAFSYDELRQATLAILGGSALYATNPDPVFPMPDGPWPATGALLAAVETASGLTGTVIGKPEPYLFELAGERLSGKIAVVGDRVDTDVAGGRRAGFATILVAPREPRGDPAEMPDYVVSGLGQLLKPA